MQYNIKIIVAHDDCMGIAKNDKIPWYIREDLQWFKAQTVGHPVIMGYKTFQTLSSPLSGRANIVLTSKCFSMRRNNDYELCFLPGLDIALKVAANHSQYASPTYIIGGAQVYYEAIDRDLVNEVILTHVRGNFKCDRLFPVLQDSKWSRRLIMQNDLLDRWSYTRI